MKKTFKLIASFILVLIALFSPSPARAADFEVTCDPGGCGPAGAKPVFYETNIFPGWSVTKTIKAINNYSETRQFAVEAENYNNVDHLGDVLNIDIRETGSATSLYNNNLTNFDAVGYTLLSTVGASGGEQEYEFTVSMPTWVGNAYQAKTVILDLTLGFEMVAPPPPTPTPTPTPSTDGDSPDTPPGCHDPVPTSAPILDAIAGINTVTLTWTPVSPVTHYAIQYGITPDVYIYGASNVGNVTTYVVSGLSSGFTYYFQVMGVNGCMPGPWSKEASATPGGEVFGVTEEGVPPPAEGFFEEEVLGETTPEEGEIQGIAEGICEEEPTLWWLPLLIQLIISALFVYWARNNDGRGFWPILLVLAVLSQLAHWFIFPCNCATHWLCNWFWLFNLIILAFHLIWLFREKDQPEQEVEISTL